MGREAGARKKNCLFTEFRYKRSLLWLAGSYNPNKEKHFFFH